MSRKREVLTIFLALFFVFALGTRSSQAAIKDSDFDGLSDSAERDIYHTDPGLFDTDGDGRGDGDEILDKTDPLDKDSSLLATLIRPDQGLLGSPDKFAWYFGRASGILSFVLLTWVVAFGLVISSRSFTGVIFGATAYEIHRFVSWLALGTVILHFSSFFFDKFMNMRVIEALVPFMLAQNFQTVSGFNIGLAVSFGIIAFYLILILILTSEFRSKISPKVWRGIHYVSAAAYMLFIIHGFATGTDSKEWWMKALYATSAVIVFSLVLLRISARNLAPMWKRFRERKSAKNDVPSEIPPEKNL